VNVNGIASQFWITHSYETNLGKDISDATLFLIIHLKSGAPSRRWHVFYINLLEDPSVKFENHEPLLVIYRKSLQFCSGAATLVSIKYQ